MNEFYTILLNVLGIVLSLPIMLILYIVLFPYLSIPNFIFTERLSRALSNSNKHKQKATYVFIFPVIGLAFYATIDMFERYDLFVVWVIILTVISLAPLTLYLVIKRNLPNKKRA